MATPCQTSLPPPLTDGPSSCSTRRLVDDATATDAEINKDGGALAPAAAPSERRWEAGFVNGIRGRVINFTPSWFSVNMGTGITSIILHNLPYQFHGLRLIATIIFALNASLFILFLLVTIARYAFYPRIWTSMINHNVQSLFWGTFAMGFATVGDGIVLFCVPAFGGRWVQLAWACWWIDAVLSLVIGIGLPFLMFTRHKNEVSQVTGVWLLPIVAPIVAAAMGGIVSDVLPPDHARLTIIISYMLLGCGLGPALLVQALYFQRLAIYKSPPMATIVSVFLPIGPCGQSAFAFLQLAAALRRVHAIDGKGLGGSATDVTGAIYALSFLAALFMMGMGFFWLVIAIATSLDLARRPGGFPFNMGWWGFTFPLGTMATSAILLAAELDSTAFRAFAMVLSVPVVLFWLFVGLRTAIEAVRGTVFVAPCLGACGKPPAKKTCSSQSIA